MQLSQVQRHCCHALGSKGPYSKGTRGAENDAIVVPLTMPRLHACCPVELPAVKPLDKLIGAAMPVSMQFWCSGVRSALKRREGSRSDRASAVVAALRAGLQQSGTGTAAVSPSEADWKIAGSTLMVSTDSDIAYTALNGMPSTRCPQVRAPVTD